MEKSWEKYQFEPIILSRQDAKKSLLYNQYYDFIQRVHDKSVGKNLPESSYCLAAQLEKDDIMSGWNYRVFTRIHTHKYLPEPETLYEIREAYYDDQGNINGWTQNPDIIAHSLEELKDTLNKMILACDKTIVKISEDSNGLS